MAINPRVVLRYFHIYVGSDHFSGLKFLKFNIFWSFQKMIIFGDMKLLCLLGGGGVRGGGGGVLTKLD